MLLVLPNFIIQMNIHMKKFLILSLFACFAFGLTAQDAKTVDGPKMEMETLDVDYGTIEQHSDPVRKVSFTNTGTEPLVIKNARGSCGCTVPIYPKEPILPGESEVIEIRYDTKRIGPFTKSVKITTNAGDEKIVLKVHGKVLKQEDEDSVPAASPNMLSPK